MKKFTINCDFGGQMAPFTIFIGKPQQGHHPLHFQADWLSNNRGGMIPGEVMEAITQLQELSDKNNVSLENLCVYALGTDEQQQELEKNESNNSNNVVEAKNIINTNAPEKHEVADLHTHESSEEAEDMSSEGGHV